MTNILDIKKVGSFLILVAMLFFSFLPTPLLADEADTLDASGKKNNTGITYECKNGDCDFNDLIKATQRVVKFGVQFALSFSVVVIAYAGYLYMISGANPTKRGEANKMLQKVAIGIFFILAAWFIVSLILNSLKVETPIQFK